LPNPEDASVREDLTRKMRVFAASLMLGACGFRLAGSDPLPTILAHPYLSLKDPYTDFSRVFEHRLKVAGAALQSNSEGASATIEVTRDQVDQRTLAVTGSTPTQPANIPTLYELTYTVTYRVRGPDKELIAPQTISLARSYSYNANLQLAKEREADVLRKQMAEDLVAVLMHRLTSLK
jgi:LPS-assembly lipoprotein